MDFVKCPEYQRVKLSEGDAHILTLTVQQSGVVIKDNRPLISYSVLEGKLIRTTIPSRSVYQFRVMPNFQALSLGNHPIADQLRSLEISTTTLAHQAHHLDLEFYDKFYQPGAYTETQGNHMEQWH